MKSPEFVFSSLHPATKGSPTPYLPRARFCIFRGFWAELPENKHNEAEKNERVYESDLPTFTTDVRMNKPIELFSSSSGHADHESLVQGSGGGGPCEAVWWVTDVMVQWRIKGEAFVMGPDIEGGSDQSKESSGVRTVKSEVGGRMRVLKEDGKNGWSWQRELTAHFGNMSPGMRGELSSSISHRHYDFANYTLLGTFAAPPPGQQVDKPYDDKHLKLGEKVEDLHDATARENFRVVIIRPEEVESVDLSDPKKSRRQVYKYDSQSGDWTHEECWP